MKVIQTEIHDALILEPKVFGDARGFFLESYNKRVLAEAAGIRAEFVQDNHSRSARGVLRGLHYQLRQPQGKLVRVSAGSVFDVAVDLRRSSPTFGKTACVELSDANQRMFWLPPGLAHGFLVLSDTADFLYKTTDYYAPEHERCILWNDAELAIPWPLEGEPLLSAKDRQGLPFAVAELFP
ncbi:MAG TPA: dTDP-4-dehydrorhamnose 3,5-epimerase [Candidatus Desulfobacillus denitrificans]|nr:dTDP-4-dehydrorhamnose 3,5-epimerase [Rhodocyclaceae bacterium]HNQ57132.1 dTDP-4-dehydrorhamnose 3,5-epimerase [Candidatus Desulfobacillus denitrificans]HNT62184.1 dTDP-4-dehydrorhamnose 3,5-epimerase [Candidatus Desulfobacillus denitrificans]